MSLDLTLDARSGPTVRAMALLPLAGLWKLRELPSVQRRREMGRLLTQALRELDAGHFTLANPDPLSADLLQFVWEKPSSLFPFSYR